MGVGAAAAQVFNDMSPEQYAALMLKAGAAGFNISGNEGTASQFGVEVAWKYSPEARQLSIQCVSVPFFLSADTVDARIRELVSDALK
jgi:hypothetical protein